MADHVYRIDTGELRKPVRMDNGWVRVEARITKTGIFEYIKPDGNIQRELRVPEEVFNADAVDSFELVPVLDGHPPRGQHILDSQTARLYQKGSVGKPVRDGEYLRAPMLITDGSLASKLDAKQVQEVSCGYRCLLEPAQAGAHHDGKPYDFIQREIRGNHVAVVPIGRAGSDVRIRLDSAGSVEVESETSVAPAPKEQPVIKVNIRGVDVEVSEQAAQALKVEAAEVVAKMDASDKATAALKAELAKVLGERDGLQGELTKEKAAHVDAVDPKKLDALVAERTKLTSVVVKAMGAEFKMDGLSTLQLQAEVLKKVSPGFDPAGKDPAYIQGRFDTVAESIGKLPHPTVTSVRAAAEFGTPSVSRMDGLFADLKADKSDAERRADLASIFDKASKATA